MNQPLDQALCDVLSDLRHDFAKYLCLPLRMLPRDASTVAVGDALEEALLRTRRGPSGVLGARELYASFRRELSELGAAEERLQHFDTVVANALRWEAVLGKGAAIERAAIEQDFNAVAQLIETWQAEVCGG